MRILAVIFLFGLLTVQLAGSATGDSPMPYARVGDSWTYQEFGETLLHIKYTDEIVRSDDSSGQLFLVHVTDFGYTKITSWYTREWGLAKMLMEPRVEGPIKAITFLPAYDLYGYPLSLGKEWTWSGKEVCRCTYPNGTVKTETMERVFKHKVVALETVQTPAGSFEAYLVEKYDHDRLDSRYWISMDVKAVVRMEQFPDATGKFTSDVQLISYSLADFDISTSETTIPITVGENGTVEVSVERVSGFSAPVAITVLGVPKGVSYQTLAESGSSYTVVLHASNQAPTGEYSIRIIGSGDNLFHEISVKLQIKPGGVFRELAFGIQIIHLIALAVILGIVAFLLSRRRSALSKKPKITRPTEATPRAVEDKCPKCGGRLSFLTEFKEWYCYGCGTYYKPKLKKS